MKKGQMWSVLITALVAVLVIIALLNIFTSGFKLFQRNKEASKLQHFESFTGLLKNMATTGEQFMHEDAVATIPRESAYVAFNNDNAEATKVYHDQISIPSTCVGVCICYFEDMKDFGITKLDHVPCVNFPTDTVFYSFASNDNVKRSEPCCNYGKEKIVPEATVDGNDVYEQLILTTTGKVEPIYFDKVHKNGKNFIYVGFYDAEYQKKRIEQLR